MEVHFRTQGKMGDQQKSVTVVSNDPQRPSLSLTVKGIVIMPLRTSPKNLDFKEVCQGESKTLPLKVIPWKGEKFEILNVESPGPQFKVEVVSESEVGQALKDFLDTAKERIVDKFGAPRAAPETQPNTAPQQPADPDANAKNARTLNVTILAGAHVGRNAGTLRVYTDLPKKPMVEVRVTANVVGNIKIEPERFNFGNVKVGESRETTFLVTTREGTAVQVEKVETSSEFISAKLAEPGTAPGQELKVSLSPKAPPGPLYGSVTIYTTDQDQPQVSVRVYAAIVQ